MRNSHWTPQAHSKSSPASPLSSLNSMERGDCRRKGSTASCWRGWSTCLSWQSRWGCSFLGGRHRALEQCFVPGLRLTHVPHAEVGGNRRQHQTETNIDSRKPPSKLIPQLPTPLEHQQILTPCSQIPDHLGNTDEKGSFSPVASTLAESTC